MFRWFLRKISKKLLIGLLGFVILTREEESVPQYYIDKDSKSLPPILYLTVKTSLLGHLDRKSCTLYREFLPYANFITAVFQNYN